MVSLNAYRAMLKLVDSAIESESEFRDPFMLENTDTNTILMVVEHAALKRVTLSNQSLVLPEFKQSLLKLGYQLYGDEGGTQMYSATKNMGEIPENVFLDERDDFGFGYIHMVPSGLNDCLVPVKGLLNRLIEA